MLRVEGTPEGQAFGVALRYTRASVAAGCDFQRFQLRHESP